MKMNRLIPILLVAITIYAVSFCIIRVSYAADNCSLQVVDIPDGALRSIYRPMINMDKLVNTNVIYPNEIDEVRFAQKYRCGE